MMARNPANLGFIVTQCDVNQVPIVVQYTINPGPVMARETNLDPNFARHVHDLGLIQDTVNPSLSECRALETQRSQSCEALKKRILKRRANFELSVEFENQFVKKTKAGKVVCIPAHHVYLRMGVVCLFCLQPYDSKADYVGCDKCPHWYHLHCVNLTLEEIQMVDDYICPVCNAISLAVEEMRNHKYGRLFSRKSPESSEFRRLFPKLDCIEDLVRKAKDGYPSLGEFRDQINEMYKTISNGIDERNTLHRAILEITQAASNIILTLIPNHPDLY
ncbi:hypothetical protein FO519_003960 [Halicephalobus sp. NKZ332]|nr:hypothetical protein FO519_003960 [Halicephalobus sp. NKZ332]